MAGAITPSPEGVVWPWANPRSMTTEHQASRTLVKSPPELWAECSDAGSLARHLGEFGEIRITRLEPETSVCWEAEHASGKVEIEPSGWGTRVTLTAQTGAAEESAGAVDDEVELADSPAAQANSVEEEINATVEETHAEPDPAVAGEAGPKGGRWKRLIARTRTWFRASDAPPAVEADEAAVEASTPPPTTTDPPEDVSITPEPEPVSEEDEPTDAGGEGGGEGGGEAPSPDPAAVLASALDSLGQAHHRPFSRA